MQETLIKFAESHMYLHIVLITLCTTAILAAMAIDLFFGVQKAKERGEVTTSRGLKKTAKKGLKYLAPFVNLTFLDLIACFILPAPFFSMAWAAYCILCEFRSIREKAWEKKEIHDFERTIKIAASDKADIAKLLSDLLKSTAEETTATDDTE